MFGYVYSIFPAIVALLSSQKDVFGSSNYFPWPYADDIIQAMCPYNNICHLGPAEKVPYDPCCTDCRCDDGCNEGNECCFLNNTKTDYEICLYLRSNPNDAFEFTRMERTVFSYYVVAKAPNGGCYENSGSCMYSDTTEIDPVYSVEKSQIYFNRDCALCHGVKEVAESAFYFFCDELGTSKTIDFNEELIKFMDGDNSSKCFLDFYFPINDIRSRQCAIHSVDNIDELIYGAHEDTLRGNYDMQVKDIANACLSSLLAPVFSQSKQKLYPNPFCYLYGEGTHEKEQCYQSTGNPTGIEYTLLLSMDAMDILRSKEARRPTDLYQVCVKTPVVPPQNQYERCRPVTCPVGHIFDTKGRCSFIGERFFTKGRMNTFINLILRQKRTTYINEATLMNTTTDYINTEINIPSDWKLVSFGVSVNWTGDVLVDDRKDIILLLMLLSANLQTGIESIKPLLDTNVNILNETYTISFYQKKIQIEEKFIEEVLAQVQCASSVNSTTFVENGVSNCWKMIDHDVQPNFVLYAHAPLSKLYFCNLTRLMNDEYRLLANGTVLFNEIRNVYLYSNEFLVVTNENEEKIVKICSENSGLIVPDMNSSINIGPSVYLTIGCIIYPIYSMFKIHG